MLIALDYDNTYTRDPKLWDTFIETVKARNHAIVCITMRYKDTEAIEDIGIPVIYTGRKAKMAYAAERSIRPDIWIDDRPDWIFKDG